MDDKKLDEIVRRVEASMEAIEKSIKDIADHMQALRSQAENELHERVEHLRLLTTAPKYISGRWPRRDGDGSLTRTNIAQADPNHGDGKTGDL